MSSPFTRIAAVDAERAKALPTHIVLSSRVVNARMLPKELGAVCERYVDTMLRCIASDEAPGIYVPSGDAATTAETAVAGAPVGGNDVGSGRDAIVRAMVSGLENDFLPCLMDIEDAAAEHAGRDADSRAHDAPEFGVVFTKRGGVMSMGSIAGCGLGVVGVFIGGL
jgi:hypothetical protein